MPTRESQIGRTGAAAVSCAAGAAIAGIWGALFSWGGVPRLQLQRAPDAQWLPLRSIAYKSPDVLQNSALRELSDVVYGLLLVGVLTALLAFVTLLLTVASQRKRDFATRAALGAAPRDLLSLLVRPIVRIALIGAVGGVLLALPALWLIDVAWPGVSPDSWWLRSTRASAGVLGFTIVATVLAVGGAWLFTTQGALARSLSAGERATADHTETRLREVLLVLQVTASVLLLAVSLSLLTRSPEQTKDAVERLSLRDLVVARIEADDAQNVVARTRALQQLMAQLHRSAGVSAESIASAGAVTGTGPADLIYSECDVCDFFLYGRMPVTVFTARVHAAGPGYFDTVGQRLLRGREFSVADTTGAEPVAIITRAFAARVFRPGDNPVGRKVRMQAGKGRAHRIVGVVENRAGIGLGSTGALTPTVYFSALQYPPAALDVLVRGAPPALQNIVFVPLEGVQRAAVAPITFMVRGLNLLALLCLLLAIYGVATVVRALVEGARAELGVRRMVGAPPRALVTVLVKRAARIGLAGAFAGAVIGLGALRVLQAALPNAPVDGRAIAGAAVLLLLVCVSAAAAPALRTARSVER